MSGISKLTPRQMLAGRDGKPMVDSFEGNDLKVTTSLMYMRCVVNYESTNKAHMGE